MKLKVIKVFFDKAAAKLREVGEVFDADAERAAELLAHELHLVEQVDEPEAAKAAAPKKPTAKKSAAKNPVEK